MKNRKSSSDSKKLLNLFSNKRKSTSNSNQDSGFAETDSKGVISLSIYIYIYIIHLLVDQSLISNSYKHRSKISPDKSEEDGSIITQKSFEIIHSDQQSNGM